MKLYAVSISYKAYVLAEDEETIEDHISEIKSWENDEVEFYETKTNCLGWTADCLVYHEGANDITIRQALNMVNNKEEKTDA